MSVQRRVPVTISDASARQPAPPPPGLFPGKLRAPVLATGCLRRPRLEEAIADGVARGLLVVSAPAGSGKTQLVATWAHHRAAPPDVAWVTLGDSDRDPVRFVRYLVAAIASTPAGGRAMISPRGLPSVSTITEAFLLQVSDALSRLTEDVVVVLDDFQAVVGSPSERLGARVLRYQPAHVGFVVLSRAEPDLGLTRLRLEGRVAEISAADLALTREECAALLRLHDVTLDDAQLEVLRARTEGWPAAMQVLVASMRGSPDPDGFVAGLREGESFIADYLMTEVFEKQPRDLQQFLLRASTANPTCGDLADAVTGRRCGDRTFAELVGAHVFLDRTLPRDDQGRSWYRWHPMFAGLLQQRLRATEPDAVEPLHLAAAVWCDQHGFSVDAFRQAVAGGDTAMAARTLGEAWLGLVIGGESAELHALVSLLTQTQQEEHAELAVAAGYVGLQHRDLERASACAERALALAGVLPDDRRLAVETAGAAILLHVATMTGDDRSDCHASALALLRRLEEDRPVLTLPQRQLRALLLFHVGAYEVSRWLYDEPRGHLSEAAAAASLLDMPRLALAAEAQLAFVDFVSGGLDDAWTTAERVVDAASRRGWRGSSSVATAHHVLGAVAVVRGDVDTGLRHLAEADGIRHPLDEVNQLRSGFATHVALRATGRVEEARQELERLRARARRRRTRKTWADPLLVIAEAEQLALEDHPDQALRLVDAVPGAGFPPVVHGEWAVVRALLLLRCGRPDEARAALEDVVRWKEDWPVGIRGLVVDALAADALGQHAESLQVLDHAVGTAARLRVREPFLVCGPEVQPLLQDLLDRGTPHEAEVLDLLGLLASRQRPAGAGVPHLIEPLTPRELEVLRNLQGTRPNEQIAQRMFISLNTLRTHTKHIHRKLGTRSRREAVERARDLGIL